MHPIVRSIQSSQIKIVPKVQAGYTVRVSQKIKEGSKERIQRFEGLVIKVSHGETVEKTFTVRKIVEGIGVEKIFPFHSPNITEIKVLKKAKVRRSKLYYMRERFGKSARLSERQVSDQERLEGMESIETRKDADAGVKNASAAAEAIVEASNEAGTQEPPFAEVIVDPSVPDETPADRSASPEEGGEESAPSLETLAKESLSPEAATEEGGGEEKGESKEEA